MTSAHRFHPVWPPLLALSIALVGMPAAQAVGTSGSEMPATTAVAMTQRTQPKRSIQVTITGLPAGVSARVTVKGPKGFTKRVLKASALLKKLPKGQYTITAQPVQTSSGSAPATVSKPKVRVKKNSRLKVGVTYRTPTPTPTPEPSPTPTPAGQAIAEAIQGSGVTITNPVYSGSNEAQGPIAGVFGAPTGTAMLRSSTSEAWLLSTGLVADALKDPPEPGDSFFASYDFMLPGDDTLASLLPLDEEGNRPSTRDAAFVTFRVVPQGTRLDIRYRFASEEYNEWVGSRYNDVMGIFVNGANCATVPDPSGGAPLAVAVNSVNSGGPSGEPPVNPELHVDNLYPPYKANTSFDGFTVPLTCSVATTPGTPLEVKVGVADTSDGIFDTAIALLNDGVSSS